ncbi:hypothetical protein Purlil1_12518 [Purpureocillium lilacinum]|uniref:C2H2-type domain-containing protein n=1 Tax=Purpureocillium lilacinum TaxID=33203 RepID=A0ABR0BH98_PURLI|nr:hypothetical protein Purlil1_12518 [Purpureocillium lilacinum]
MSDITTSTAPGAVDPGERSTRDRFPRPPLAFTPDPLPVTSSWYVLLVADLALIAAAEININVKTVAESSKESDKTRPHVCAACQRSFARLEHLNRHERTHTREKPFECLPESEAAPDDNAVLTLSPPAAAVTAGANSAAACMRPRLNSTTHVDGAAMQMFASGNASTAARGTAAQSCPSLISFPIHSDQGETQHSLPKLDSPQTVPPLLAFDPRFNFNSASARASAQSCEGPFLPTLAWKTRKGRLSRSIYLLGAGRAQGKVDRVRSAAVGALLCGCTGIQSVSNPTTVLATWLASAAIARVVVPAIVALLRGSGLGDASCVACCVKKAPVVLDFLGKGYDQGSGRTLVRVLFRGYHPLRGLAGLRGDLVSDRLLVVDGFAKDVVEAAWAALHSIRVPLLPLLNDLCGDV